jgi:general stress protein 26
MGSVRNLNGSAAHTTPDERRRHLRQIIDHFKIAMLINRDAGDAMLVARPMRIARVDDDGMMYFAASTHTLKTRDVEVDTRVCVTMQNKTCYASLTGTCRVTRDPDLIAMLWDDSWKSFFPIGANDPSLCILIVDPERAEYWDETGATGLPYLFQAAKAYVTGHAVDLPVQEHAEVQLGR